MKKYFISLLLFLLFGCQTAPTALQPVPKASVTFVSNAGFLVTLGDKKILIDGISKVNEDVLPEEVRKSLTIARPPFDKLDLILATHAHADHFDAEGVVQALRKNQAAIFIAYIEAVDQVLAMDGALSERTIGISLKSGEKQEQTVNGIRVVAYSIAHGIRPDGSTGPNLGFLAEANGVKFFHSGDLGWNVITPEYFQQLGLPEEHIDIAVLPYEAFTDFQSLAITGVSARYYVPGHYDTNSSLEYAELIQVFFPEAVLFDQYMETWVMP